MIRGFTLLMNLEQPIHVVHSVRLSIQSPKTAESLLAVRDEISD